MYPPLHPSRPRLSLVGPTNKPKPNELRVGDEKIFPASRSRVQKMRADAPSKNRSRAKQVPAPPRGIIISIFVLLFCLVRTRSEGETQQAKWKCNTNRRPVASFFVPSHSRSVSPSPKRVFSWGEERMAAIAKRSLL